VIDVFIQARLGSKRFPKKVFKKIGKYSVLSFLIKRLENIQNVNNIVVLTTYKKEDDKIVNFCLKNKIKYFRGKNLDLLTRYYKAAIKFNSKHIMRITSDCPFLESQFLKKFINFYLENNYDLVTNTIKATYPDGFDFWIFNRKSLKKSFKNAKLKYQREHMTQYMIENPKKFKIYNFISSIDYSKLRLCIDYKKDLILLNKIFKYFNKINFSYNDIIKYYKTYSKHFIINSKYFRNEGLEKSIKNEYKKS